MYQGFDRSWYTIQAADLRHFIIYNCHGICSLAEVGKVLQAICGYQMAVIKGLLVVKRSHTLDYVTPNNALAAPCLYSFRPLEVSTRKNNWDTGAHTNHTVNFRL